MTVTDHVRKVIAALPPGSSLTITVEGLQSWLNGETGVTIFRASIVEALHVQARPQTPSGTETRPRAPSSR